MGNPHRGRVKFQYKNADGTLCNPKFKNKHSLYSYIAQMIPKLKSRVEGNHSLSNPSQLCLAVRMRDQAMKQKQQAAQAQSSGKNSKKKKITSNNKRAGNQFVLDQATEVEVESD